MNLGDLSRRMFIRSKAIKGVARIITNRAALASDQAVVLGTPVDTGNARSNWQLTIGSPAKDVIEAYSPGDGLGAGERENASAAISQATSALQSRSYGQTIFITNNTSYIRPLNDGSSAQAPAGFIEEAVEVGVNSVRGAKFRITVR